MKRDEILQIIKELAKSQGFYSRLLQCIEESTDEDNEAFFSHLESLNLKDSVDLVIYLEEG